MKHNKILYALKKAFPYTIPVFFGYWFLGLTYGFLMKSSGFHFLFPFFTALIIYGGSLEYVCVSLLMAPFAPVATFIMAFLIQARHLFYGIAMLDRYKGYGWKKFYYIYAMSDETFSVIFSTDIPEDVDKGWFMLWISFLDQMYWALAALTGGILGSFIKFNTTGLDFVMTAMFVVIFMEQLMKEKKPYTGIIGFVCSVLMLKIFGPGNFLIPAMISMLVVLTALRKPIQTVYAEELGLLETEPAGANTFSENNEKGGE